MKGCDTTALLAYDDALEQLTSSINALGNIIELELRESLGQVLAQTIEAAIDVPGCAMSSMDGYAINTADLAQTGVNHLPVSQRIAAGKSAQALAPGSAARIFTGAPIPAGADAVIMQEQVTVDENTIRFETRPPPGNNIRPRGNDIERGTTILKKGCRLTHV